MDNYVNYIKESYIDECPQSKISQKFDLHHSINKSKSRFMFASHNYSHSAPPDPASSQPFEGAHLILNRGNDQIIIFHQTLSKNYNNWG